MKLFFTFLFFVSLISCSPQKELKDETEGSVLDSSHIAEPELHVSEALQERPQAELNIELDSIEYRTTKYRGTYNFGGNVEESNGLVMIYPFSDTTCFFYLFSSRGAPSYNMSSIDGV